VLIFFYNFFNSIKNGEKAEGNVWNSRSPEWQVPSPMPAHNYEQPFEVVGEPYDYGSGRFEICQIHRLPKAGTK
jgi:cytochrome c oxidase subunit I